MTPFRHVSIMPEEVLGGLNVRPDGIYLDGTLGGGGHSFLIAQLLKNGRLIGIDRDAQAIEAARERLRPFCDKVTIIKDNYKNAAAVLNELGVEKVDGILLDLGVSSHQLDSAERGFSYMHDAPLDMRMDQEETATAYDIVNGYSENELYRLIRDYGEDGFAKNIAKHIVAAREKAPIKTTFELSEIISGAIPMKIRKNGGHPAKKTFQAIRIELNGELTALEETIDGLIDMLNPGGRICIISFHSLEDRIIKNAFRKAENPCTCPPQLPVCICGAKQKGRIITKKPITPSEDELKNNTRAKSAKLRILERV